MSAIIFIVETLLSLAGEAPDPALGKQAKQRRVRYALSNSFGFGGTNASLIVGPV